MQSLSLADVTHGLRPSGDNEIEPHLLQRIRWLWLRNLHSDGSTTVRSRMRDVRPILSATTAIKANNASDCIADSPNHSLGRPGAD